MSYSPRNTSIFCAAMAGALAGMAASGRVPTDPSSTSDGNINVATVAGAFAQGVDSAWGGVPPNSYELQAIQAVSEATWEERQPNGAIAKTSQSYTQLALALVAVVKAGSAYLASPAVDVAPEVTAQQIQICYVFRPGGQAGGSVYTDFKKLFAVLKTIQGPRIVEFDPSLAPCIIPAGAYDFGAFNVEWRGALASGAGFGDFRTEIHIAEGVTFPNNPPAIYSRLNIINDATATIPINITTGVIDFIARWTTFFESTNNVPFINAAGTSYVVLNLFDQSILVQGYCVSASAVGATMFVGGFDDGTIYNDTVTKSVGSTLQFFTYSATASASLAQSGLPGGAFVINQDYIYQAGAEFTYYNRDVAFPFLPLVDNFFGFPNLQVFLDAFKGFIAGAAGADLTNADVTITLAQGYWRRLPAATLTANHTCEVADPGGVNYIGQQLTITKLGVENFTYQILDQSGAPIFTFRALTGGFVKLQWVGGWVVRECGTFQ